MKSRLKKKMFRLNIKQLESWEHVRSVGANMSIIARHIKLSQRLGNHPVNARYWRRFVRPLILASRVKQSDPAAP